MMIMRRYHHRRRRRGGGRLIIGFEDGEFEGGVWRWEVVYGCGRKDGVGGKIEIVML